MSIQTNLELIKYLNVPNAYAPQVVPNSNKVTFLSKKSGFAQVWEWDADTSQSKQLTNTKDRVISVHHSSSGEKMIVGMDDDGNEQQQFYLITADGVGEALVVSPGHFHHFGGWSPDEAKITYSSNRRHPGYFDIFVYDLTTNMEKVVYESEGNCQPLCWTNDGKNIIFTIPESNIDNALYILNLETSKKTRIGVDELARYQFLDVVGGGYTSIELTSDEQGGFLLTDLHRETLGIYKFSFSNPTTFEEVFAVENWDIEEIKLSPNEQKLAYVVNEGGISQLRMLDLKSQSHQSVNSLPTGVINSLSWLNNNDLIIGLKSAVLPGDVWKVSTKDMSAERLTFFGREEEIEHLWTEPELLEFTSFDGRKIPYFYYGKRNASQAIFMYVHGGPEHQSRSEFQPVLQFLAAQGIGVVAPNVRGSMGYGRTYVRLDDARKRMDAVTDLAWLVKDLVANHGADEDKVGIMGRSYGGFMVLAALAHYPDIWTAGVDIVGISHFKTFLENTGSWRRWLRECEYGSLENDLDFFEEIAPMNHTDKMVAPLLLFHGRNDTRVPVSEAEQIAADLIAQGKEAELVIFEDEGHQTEKPENHIKMNTMIVEFMRKHLK